MLTLWYEVVKNKNMNKEFLTVRELAEILAISRQAVIKKIKRKQIKAEKIGRDYIIKRKDLNKVLYEDLTDKLKNKIKLGVEKVVTDYGEVLKKLGKE